MLGALCDQQAEFMVVGVPRATGDSNIWVRPTPDNSQKVWSALIAFGAPLFNLTREDLCDPGIVFQIGLPPNRIDILTRITGVEFEKAWGERLEIIVQGRTIPVLGKDDLIHDKVSTGRPKDLGDAETLRNG